MHVLRSTLRLPYRRLLSLCSLPSAVGGRVVQTVADSVDGVGRSCSRWLGTSWTSPRLSSLPL